MTTVRRRSSALPRPAPDDPCLHAARGDVATQQWSRISQKGVFGLCLPAQNRYIARLTATSTEKLLYHRLPHAVRSALRLPP